MEYKQVIKDFNKEFTLNFNLNYTDKTLSEPSEKSKDVLKKNGKNVHSSFIKFYSEVGSYSLDWQNTIELEADVAGSVKILQPEKVLSDWKEVIYFEDDSSLKYFKVFDQFSEDACCGFYTTESKSEPHHVLYYYDFHNEAFSLHLDLEGYIQMMILSKGFLYWQKVLLDYLMKKESGNTKLMKNNLHKVFEDFDFKNFIEKYKAIKL
ncbi:hypothetical protein AHMF7605_01695 [Adhaeribacter arboris]|uniref:SMI1/KNR4 family protein n=1 Tax=Adhaeribacter arboris TaxID=2072846 RepID=A0A2T2Y9Z9_9BACT|nr:hypothetical protein [Adhaeribacter arboris]PSR52323.1 hypothetical protein AHMF7605_01695 [Adhaeribacter arboris]